MTPVNNRPFGSARRCRVEADLSILPPQLREAGDNQSKVNEDGGWAPGLNLRPSPSVHSRSALEQAEYVLRRGIGLAQHRGAGLLQNLSTGQRGGFGRKVGVLDSGTRRAQGL